MVADEIMTDAFMERRMTRILEGIGDRFYIVDRHWRLMYLNRSAERYFATDRGSVVGRSVWEVFPGLHGTTFELHYRRAMEHRQSVTFEAFSPLSGRWVEVHVYPCDEGIALFFHDIDDRRRAQEALRSSEEGLATTNRLLEVITNRLPVLISYVDEAEVYRFANEAYERWFGAGATLGRSVRDVIGESAYQVVGPKLKRALAGEEVHFESRVEYRGAGVRDVSVSYIPDVRDGRVQGLVALVQDVSEYKRLQESLEEADRRKDEFLATLAHELRNPLAPIRNASALLQRSGSTDPIVRNAQQMIERQVRHMVQLVDDLLDVSRITLGRIALRRQDVTLQAVVESAVETSRPLIDARGHALTVSMPEHPLRVHGDPTRLLQILQNLLNNAAKYTPAGGRIALDLRADGDRAVLSVRDDGLGIPAAMLPRIFDPFTQVEQSLEHSQGGLGIGLTLVRRLVELHGGTVLAHSEGPGRGSEFVVRLPLLPTDAAADLPPGSLRQEKAAAAAHVRRILVVDDNRDAALSLAALLEVSGHSVRVAFDGLEALKEAGEFRPECVLLDLSMPGIDGYETCRQLRAQAGDAQPRIIALSGWAHEAARQRATKAGFDGFLMKPVDAAQLEGLLD